MDHLLVPANRKHMSFEEQLRELLEKLDLTTAMKSSPSRSRRLKLLKKIISDVRMELSLRKALPAVELKNSEEQAGYILQKGLFEKAWCKCFLAINQLNICPSRPCGQHFDISPLSQVRVIAFLIPTHFPLYNCPVQYKLKMPQNILNINK